MSRRVVVWLVAVVLGMGLISACVPAAPQETDPNVLIAMGQGSLKSTQEAADLAKAQADLQAARDANKADNEIRVIEAQVKAKQAEVDLQLTQNANDILVAAAHVTQTADANKASLEVLDTQKKQVETQLEIAKKQRQDQSDAIWSGFWQWAWPVVLFLLSLVVILSFPRVVKFIQEQSAKWQEQKRQSEKLWEDQQRLQEWLQGSIVMLEDGSKYHFDQKGEMIMLEPGKGPKALPQGAVAGKWSSGAEITVRSVGASVNISKPRTVGHSTTDRCLELVNAAIQKEGVSGQVIPRFNNIVHYDGTPYYSEEWQELTGAMEADGLLIVISSGDKNGKPGTYLTDPDDGGRYENLGRLRDALQSGNQFVRPLRKAPSPSERLPVAGD